MVGRVVRADGPANLFHYSLSIPGEVNLSESGCAVSAEICATATSTLQSAARRATAVIQLDAATKVLGVRNRRPGDRFRPLGLGGRKKLQDFFVDRRIARDRRDFVPIVVDGADRIVWVAGHAIDETFRVKDPAQSVVILRVKGRGGSV